MYLTRSKLEYLTRAFEIQDRKLLPVMFGYDSWFPSNITGGDFFTKRNVQFLENPDTQDENLLKFLIVGYKLPGMIDDYKQYCSNHFIRINNLFKRNNTVPIFTNPKDLPGCLAIRNDVIQQRPEEELNRFFGVERFEEFEPYLLS